MVCSLFINSTTINKNQENSLSSLFEKTSYEIIDGSLFKVTNKKGNKVYQKLANFVPYLKNETIIDHWGNRCEHSNLIKNV